MAKGSNKKSLWDKVKEFDEDFAISSNTMTDEQLKNSIIQISNDDDRLQKAKKEDLDLIRAREELAECNKTYSVPLNRNKLKRQLAIEVLQGRGKLAT